MNQILSQNEVDALLQGIKSGEIKTEEGVGKEQANSSAFDFLSGNLRIKGTFPAMDMVYEVFCRKLRAVMSHLFGKIVENISLRDTCMMKYKEYIGNIQLPSSFQVVRMNPLRGLALIVIDSKLAFSFIESMLGGKSETGFVIEDREFTNIEMSLIKKMHTDIASELQRSWNGVYPIKIEEVSIETNPQFISICFPSDMVVVTSIDVDILGSIDICIPCSIIEPLKGKLNKNFSSIRTDVDLTWRRMMLNQLTQTELEITVELGEAVITGKELLNLKPGDVINLNTGPSDEFKIYIEGYEKLKGVAGAVRGNKAAQLTKGLKKRRNPHGRRAKRKRSS